MKIAFLTSLYPYEKIGKAGNSTLYEIIRCLLLNKHEVKVFFCSHKDLIANTKQKKSLMKYGKISLEDFSSDISTKNFKKFKYFRKVFQSYKNIEDFKLYKKKILSSIDQFVPDRIIFFWDTLLELLIDDLGKYHTVYYGAKPPYAAYKNSIKNYLNIKNIINLIIFKKREKLHLNRVRKMQEKYNISFRDTLYYKKNKIVFGYLQNTTKDKYKNRWNEGLKRKKIPKILGNISDINATGNTQGLRFINDKLFPLIGETLIKKKIYITISGSGDIDKSLKNILSSRVFRNVGYVKNLQALILRSDIILMMNNAGSYTGGYTRIIDFFSAGSCVIAHNKLADEMPEVKNEFNILLGKDEFEIRNHLYNCINNFNLRKKIGVNARNTFEKFYHPSIISHNLISKIFFEKSY